MDVFLLGGFTFCGKEGGGGMGRVLTIMYLLITSTLRSWRWLPLAPKERIPNMHEYQRKGVLLTLNMEEYERLQTYR